MHSCVSIPANQTCVRVFFQFCWFHPYESWHSYGCFFAFADFTRTVHGISTGVFCFRRFHPYGSRHFYGCFFTFFNFTRTNRDISTGVFPLLVISPVLIRRIIWIWSIKSKLIRSKSRPRLNCLPHDSRSPPAHNPAMEQENHTFPVPSESDPGSPRLPHIWYGSDTRR